MVSHKVCDQPEVSAALCSLKLLIYCVCLRTQSLARSLIIYIGLEIPLVSVMVSYKLCGQSEVSPALCTLKLLIYCVCLRTQSLARSLIIYIGLTIEQLSYEIGP